ncbi:MAG TPA: hypothetical protein VEO19_14980 [Terriglobia bacterium]|nr:hypothetical protein [Terriglobia bacterium]
MGSDTPKTYPAPPWKKWIVIGVSGGFTLAVLSALIVLGFIRYSSRPVPWNTGALSVVWSKAEETYQVNEKTREFHLAGFSLEFALQNNTPWDIEIPADAAIMKHLLKGGTLAEEAGARLEHPYFIPASQRAEVSIRLAYGCSDEDLTTGTVSYRDTPVCFNDALGDSDGLVLLDHKNRIEVTLPKPALGSK